MIVFENRGEIDVTAITTFGVSVKETENPIGFFGTGLKYAIAVLLRTGHAVTIRSGLTTYIFGSRKDLVRGHEFEFVIMEERGDTFPIGFTTELGKTWEPWMAYRELWCNARDEEDSDVYRAHEAPDPVADRTFVIVTGPLLEAVHEERWRYFQEDEADHTVDQLEVLRRPSSSYFYRGVKVMDLPRQGLFTYNETRALALTEDRTVSDTWGVLGRVARAFLCSQDEALIETVITAGQNTLEGCLDFHGWYHPEPSPAFLKTVARLVNTGRTVDLNSTARRVWEEKDGVGFRPHPVHLTEVQKLTLARAIDFCLRINFPISDYPIVVADNLGTGALGLAMHGTIYVAENAFHIGGTKQVASVLIEEWAHLKYGYADCTRQLQNWLFERLVSLGEELTGEPL